MENVAQLREIGLEGLGAVSVNPSRGVWTHGLLRELQDVQEATVSWVREEQEG